MSDSLRKTLKDGLRVARRAVRFARRDPAAAWLLWRMAFWVVTLSQLVKLLPLPRALKLLTPLRPRSPARTEACDPERLSALVEMLLRTGCWVFTPTCWRRAAVLYRFLLLRGMRPRVLFGVRRAAAGGVEGHAWVEVCGRTVPATETPPYQVTFAFPPDAGAGETAAATLKAAGG